MWLERIGNGMIETKTVTKTAIGITAYICDMCSKRITSDNIYEFQEMVHIRHDCGYGSVFGDGNKINLDICQHCFKAWAEKEEMPLVDELKELVSDWERRAKNQYRDTAECLAYAWSANSLKEILEKHEEGNKNEKD